MSEVSEAGLRRHAADLAYPRHRLHDREANARAAGWLTEVLSGLGLRVERQGSVDNLLARPPWLGSGPCRLVGAHYDTVPGTPGADDNASAVAALLETAAAVVRSPLRPPVAFALFNAEEDGMLGSGELVSTYAGELDFGEVHVLEMLGFCSHQPGSQSAPPLGLELPDRGDFLGLLANVPAQAHLAAALDAARTYVEDLPVLGLEVPPGPDLASVVLNLSDHAPFWRAGRPAVMWTDTAFYRNPHYHLPSDLPATLDYAFLRRVTQVLVATALRGRPGS